jgi:protein Mpv17
MSAKSDDIASESSFGLRNRTTNTSSDSATNLPLSAEAIAETPGAFSMFNFLQKQYTNYKWALQSYPIRTKAITSSTIACLGEVLGSWVKAKKTGQPFKIEPRRLLMFFLFGGCVTGPALHTWYLISEKFLSVHMKLTGRAKTMAKLFLDRCFWGPPYTLFTVCFLTFFQCFNLSQTAKEVRNKYLAILIMSQKVWVPCQLINFELVPQDFQVLFVNFVNVFWNTYLSLANPNPN